MNQRAYGKRMGSNVRLGVGAVVLAFLLGLQTAGAAQLQSVRFISTSPNANEWDIFPALDKGFFAKEGLAPEVVYMRQPQDVIRVIVAGSAPLGSSGVHYSMTAQERGGKIRVVTGRLYTPMYDIIAPPEYKSLRDLKGKKIAVAALSSIITHLLIEVMERSGVKKDEFEMLVVGGTSDRYSAVKSGRVAATMVAPPFNFTANDEGYPTLLRYSDGLKNLQFVGSFVNTDFAKTSPDTVTRFVKAAIQAQRWLNSPANKEEAIRILIKHVRGTTEQVARRTYEYTIVQNKAFRGEGAIDPEGVKTVVEILTKFGTLKDPKPWQEYCDLSFYEKAKKELGF